MILEYTILKKVPLFEGISEIELEKILAGMNVSLVHYRKGQVIARPDEPFNKLITILTGVIRGEMNDPSGKTLAVEDIQAPYSAGTLFMFSHGRLFPVLLTAKEEVTALLIPANVLFKMLTRSEILLKNYLYLSSVFGFWLVDKIYFISFLTIRQKLAYYLLEIAGKQQTDKVKVNMTHTSLGEYFGVSRQALEMEMRSMVADGLIAVNKREITLINKSKLEFIVKFSR